jgi:hypothetical protein
MSTAAPTRTAVRTPAATKPVPSPARLLQRSCACGQHGKCPRCKGGSAEAAHAAPHAVPALSPDASEPRFARDFSRVATTGGITLGDAGSLQEADADRFAEQVTRSLDASGPESRMAPVPAGGHTRRVMTYRGRDGDAAAPIERGGDTGSSGRPVPEPLESELEASRGRGRDLPQATRQTLQPYFDGDLRSVRVHDDNGAHKMASDLGAEAFALGSDVYFAAGQFSPDSSAGRRLLVHELAHTAQQHPLGRPVVRSKPIAGSKTKRQIMSVALYVDLNSVVLGMSDGSSVTVALSYNGHPNAGTYQARISSSGLVSLVGSADIGGKLNAAGNVAEWDRVPGTEWIPSSSYWIVVVAGTPGRATTATPGGAGSGKQAPPATGQGGPSKDTPGAGTGTKPVPTADQPGTGTTPAPAAAKPGATPVTGSTTPDPKATATTPADAAAKLKALPDSIKAIMGGEGAFKPEDYDKLLRIAEKLKALDSRDLELYKLVATNTTMDLDALEKSIDVFIQVKEKLREQIAAAEEQKKQEQSTEPSLESEISQTWAGFDEKEFATLDRDKKEARARDIAAKQRNVQLKHMVTHPGETALGMVEGVFRPDQAAEGVVNDLKEAADGNKSGFARAAGVFGALGKYEGYVAGVLGAIYIALLFVPGVNLAELGLTVLVVGLVAMVSTAIESELRIQAAAEAKDPEEFKSQTQKAAAAQASFLVQAALLALHLAAKLIAKIPLGGELKNVGNALKLARGKVLTVTGVGPAFEGIRADLLGRLKAARVGLREALGVEAKPLAAAAGRLRAMSGTQFLERIAAGDTILQEASGITPDMAKGMLEAAKAPAASGMPEQMRAQALKALEDAPAQAAKEVDKFINNVDQTVASVEKAKTPQELDAAAAVAQKVLSPEELAGDTAANRAAYLKARAEAELAKGQPAADPLGGEAKPAAPSKAQAPGAKPPAARPHLDTPYATLEKLAAGGDKVAADELATRRSLRYTEPRPPASTLESMTYDDLHRLASDNSWAVEELAAREARLTKSLKTYREAQNKKPITPGGKKLVGQQPVHDRGTVAVGETDIPKIKPNYEGASPYAGGEKVTEATTKAELSPDNPDPRGQGHAEQRVLEGVDAELKKALESGALNTTDLQGKTVRIHVETFPCETCKAGFGATESNGPLAKFLKKYPGLRLELSDSFSGETLILTYDQATGSLNSVKIGIKKF